MTILFGWNTYCLKSITPTELGIRLNEQSDMTIEYRQRYFHLFFIPVFPIGRFWSVRQAGKLYQPTIELEQALQQVKPEGKHWIWAWSGPLLGIAIYFIVSIMNNVEERASKNRSEKNKSMLAAFFQDKSKTTPLANKLKTIDSMIDSSLNNVDYEEKAVDTSMTGLLKLYLEARLTRDDSLIGYNERNTVVITDFPSTSIERKEVVKKEYKESLEAGDWKGYYGDTSDVFADFRKLQQYKYVLVLKEYNRLEPQIEGDGYASGYSLVRGKILSIETGKLIKDFKLMAGNSEQVSSMTVKGRSYASTSSSTMLRATLEGDLKRNVFKEAYKYVFGKENLY